MFKKVLIFLLVLTSLFAHKIVLNVIDNEDNTITIIGGYDTGQSAANALVRLESISSGKVLYEKRLSDESEMRVKIPNEPYKIVLDGGAGHTQIKEGIAPKGGFKTKKAKNTKHKTQNQQLNIAYIITLLVAIVFMILTMFFSYKNTQKLINLQKASFRKKLSLRRGKIIEK